MVCCMNERISRRSELGLTQPEAAARSGVSLATWRRWEEDPASVSAKTRAACEKTLSAKSALTKALEKSYAQFETAWSDCHYLTPRQAYSIAAVLDLWADLYIQGWLDEPMQEPLHNVGPFARFDRRIMFYVDGNQAWAEMVRDRCYAVSDEIEAGVLPFHREGAYIDELLIATALAEAEDMLGDAPDLFEGIAPRDGSPEDDEGLSGDDDWDQLSDTFDDMCQWDDWEVPLYKNHPLLPAILAERHPFTWFDMVPASGPGYLQRLAGLVVDQQEESE